MEADITLQEDGGSSAPTHISITHDATAATYTARIQNSPMVPGPTFVGGTLSPDGRALVFKSALAGTRFVYINGTVMSTVSGEMIVNLKRIPDPADDSSQSGDLTGSISLTCVAFPARSQITLTGHIPGSYKAAMALSRRE